MADGSASMIEVLYEDNHLLVVKKPPNLLTQGDDSGEVNLLDMAKLYIKEKYQKPGDVYLGMVHRLDRPVGGVITFARTSKAANRLTQQIQAREIEKYYLSVVEGNIKEKKGVLENYLIKDRNQNISFVVSKEEPGAKFARLFYEKIATIQETSESYTLLKIKLETGRSHQIRLQLAHFGHPLFGDNKYGEKTNQSTKQLALWSCEMGFTHPTTKEKMRFHTIPNVEQFPWGLFLKEIRQYEKSF